MKFALIDFSIFPEVTLMKLLMAQKYRKQVLINGKG